MNGLIAAVAPGVCTFRNISLREFDVRVLKKWSLAKPPGHQDEGEEKVSSPDRVGDQGGQQIDHEVRHAAVARMLDLTNVLELIVDCLARALACARGVCRASASTCSSSSS